MYTCFYIKNALNKKGEKKREIIRARGLSAKLVCQSCLL